MRKERVPGGGRSPKLFLLFASFLRMGVTAFGGPAMITYIRNTVVGEKKWLDPESFQDGLALCQAIPGATVMQMAAYIGLKLRGVRGAIFAFVGFGLPAFLLMAALSMAYSHTHSLPAVTSIFKGLQAVIVAVMANATLAFGKHRLPIGRMESSSLWPPGFSGMRPTRFSSWRCRPCSVCFWPTGPQLPGKPLTQAR